MWPVAVRELGKYLFTVFTDNTILYSIVGSAHLAAENLQPDVLQAALSVNVHTIKWMLFYKDRGNGIISIHTSTAQGCIIERL